MTILIIKRNDRYIQNRCYEKNRVQQFCVYFRQNSFLGTIERHDKNNTDGKLHLNENVRLSTMDYVACL